MTSKKVKVSSSLSSGWARATSLATRCTALSSPSPASTQVTSKSSTFGSPSSMARWRRRIARSSQPLGKKRPNTAVTMANTGISLIGCRASNHSTITGPINASTTLEARKIWRA